MGGRRKGGRKTKRVDRGYGRMARTGRVHPTWI
jgi:hypothetical protein